MQTSKQYAYTLTGLDTVEPIWDWKERSEFILIPRSITDVDLAVQGWTIEIIIASYVSIGPVNCYDWAFFNI